MNKKSLEKYPVISPSAPPVVVTKERYTELYMQHYRDLGYPTSRIGTPRYAGIRIDGVKYIVQEQVS